MPKHSSESSDPNILAYRIVQQAIGDASAKKNPHAVALGRLGGLKGGQARAKKLKPAYRRAIARKAAHARWQGRS